MAEVKAVRKTTYVWHLLSKGNQPGIVLSCTVNLFSVGNKNFTNM